MKLKENKKLREVVCEIIRRFPGISRTQLVKSIYVIDREYFKNTGRTMTGIEYEFYFYGPYSHEFKAVLHDLKKNNIIYENFDGISYKIFLDKKRLSEEEIRTQFSREENEAIESAIKKLTRNEKLISAKEIKKYVYSLDEVKSTEPFKKIVFKRGPNALSE
ncbi:MAG: SocA family protein [Methanobacteriaceae archaeon]|nr:SocA family protein [Methanobacteriaceae archaeon]